MTFQEIDQERKRLGLTILDLTIRAGLAPSTYWFVREGKTKPRPSTLEKLANSLRRAKEQPSPHASTRAVYRAHLARAAREFGFDPEDVTERTTKREYWKARAIAAAMTAADLDLPHAELARALRVSKQIVNWNIKQAIRMVDDPRFAWFAERAGRLTEGRVS